MATRKIITAFDARRAKYAAEAAREHQIAVREAKAKVKYWEQKVAKFGGEIQAQTLAKFKAQLEELIG